MKRLIPVIEEGGSVTEVLREPERTWLRQTLAEERKIFDEIGDDEFVKTKDDVFVLRKYRYKIDEKRSTVVEVYVHALFMGKFKEKIEHPVSPQERDAMIEKFVKDKAAWFFSYASRDINITEV